MSDFNIAPPRGINYAPNKSAAVDAWRELNLMRWEEEALTPIGGWEQFSWTGGAPASTVRAVFVWLDNGNNEYIALFCQSHVYVVINNVLTDVTPVGGIGQITLAGGYGDDFYGTGTHGTARQPPPWRATAGGTAYTMHNWGEDLLVMSSDDGRLLRWSPATPATPLTAVTNAPTGGRTFVVTPERFVLIFGYDGLKNGFGWCSQEDINDWNFASTTNTAGNLPIEPASPVFAAVQIRSGVLFWTHAGVYFARYIGKPFIYDADRIDDAATPVSPAAVVTTANGAIWPSQSGFWTYDGGGLRPINCPLWELVRKAFETSEAAQRMSAVHVSNKGEAWFLYPEVGATVNNRYVSYNYREQFWSSMGGLTRACGFDVKHRKVPYMSDGINTFKHESGNAYPGAAEMPWAETASYNVLRGSGLVTVNRIIPDVAGNSANAKFYVKARSNRTNAAELSYGPSSIQPNGHVSVRLTGRDVRVRVEAETDGVAPFTIGPMLMTYQRRGLR